MIIQTRDLKRTYRRGASVITAVNKVTLTVEDSTFVSIVGPSGSGKTTLLHLLGLNDQPTSGTILFQNRDTSRVTAGERRRIRLRCIGFVFQSFNLLPTLTALENVELPMALAEAPLTQQRKTAMQLLDAVGLASRLHHRPRELSAGEMQRVAIARALANRPTLILADEPTGELDSDTGQDIIQLLLRVCRERQTTVVVATHDAHAAKAADVHYTIRDGVIARSPF